MPKKAKKIIFLNWTSFSRFLPTILIIIYSSLKPMKFYQSVYILQYLPSSLFSLVTSLTFYTSLKNNLNGLVFFFFLQMLSILKVILSFRFPKFLFIVSSLLIAFHTTGIYYFWSKYLHFFCLTENSKLNRKVMLLISLLTVYSWLTKSPEKSLFLYSSSGSSSNGKCSFYPYYFPPDPVGP